MDGNNWTFLNASHNKYHCSFVLGKKFEHLDGGFVYKVLLCIYKFPKIFKVFFDFSEGGIIATETRNDGKTSQSKVLDNLKKF